MAHTMAYTIVNGFEAEEVITRVNERLKEGWELHGSLAVTNVTDTEKGQTYYLYAQAMTKKAAEQWSPAS